MDEWIEIYRSYKGPELDAEIAGFKAATAQGLGMFISQNQGATSYTISLAEFKSRFRAAVRVRGEAMNKPAYQHAYVDLSDSTSDR